MKNLSAWIAAYLILIANPLSAETFTNTNDDENGKSFGQLMSWVFDGEKSPDKIEIETSDQWRTLTDEDESYAVWIGHATYLINNGDINILTDPIFSKRASPIGFAGPKRMIPPVMSMKDLPKIDVVVVSHNHYDHLDMYSLKKLHKINPETIFLVPIGDGKRLKKAGLTQVHEMRWWESMEVGRSTIHFTPVQHWSKRGLFDRNKSLWGGWFFETSESQALSCRRHWLLERF